MALKPQLDAVATLLDDGKTRAALSMLRNAWSPEMAEEDRLPLYCMWIRALADLDELDQALCLAERAAEELEDEPDIHIALGNIRDMTDDLEGARTAFERAIVLDAERALAHYNVGAVLERDGRDGEAEAAYRRALVCEGTPDFDAVMALGGLLRRQGRIEQALEVFTGYLAQEPLSVDTLIEVGICLSDLGECDDACDRFEFALTLDGENPSALYNLAITRCRQGDMAQALRVMQRAHQAEPQNPLTLAVLGAWSLDNEGLAALTDAVGLLDGALDLLEGLEHEGMLQTQYAQLVVQEAFDALWSAGACSEARDIAATAARHDWITPEILETLNEVDHGRSSAPRRWSIRATAEAPDHPDHWPTDAAGFRTGLYVTAQDEDEARQMTLDYLRTIEPHPSVRFELQVREQPIDDELSDSSRALGVTQIERQRDWFGRRTR